MDPTKIPLGNVDGLRESAREQYLALAQHYLLLREDLQAARIREHGAKLAAAHLSSQTLLTALRDALVRRFGRASRLRFWRRTIEGSELFDEHWYAASYDVQGDREQLVKSFVEQGDAVGRRPNEAFDPGWYRATYPDVRDCNTLAHYILIGAEEWRRPCAAFDPRWYAGSYQDAPSSGAGCLGHYLRLRRADGRRTSGDFVKPPAGRARRDVDIHELADIARPLERPNGCALKIDVVVPVYAGLEQTRQCIESVLASWPRNQAFETLIIVDDCSPEPAIKAFLAELPRNDKIAILTNAENMGYVRSVNRAMQHSNNDVVLLNSDTSVHDDWLDRLSRHAELDPTIGTVTPFSNNAEICSFPTMRGRPALPDGFSLATLDQACAWANALKGVELPTGIGFCLFVRRQCLGETGLFDEDCFGRGYGEEVDFCLRARALGWRHIFAGDVFVFHSGGVSFGNDTPRLKLEGDAQLRQRHPSFEQDVAEWVHRNPALLLRVRLAIGLLSQRAPARLRVVDEMREQVGAEYIDGLRLARRSQSDALDLQVCTAGLTETIRVGEDEWPELLALLGLIGIESADLNGATYRISNADDLRAVLDRAARAAEA